MATEFQTKVWKVLEKIPQGKVATYSDVAQAIGRPKAVRAVGSACGANPQLVTVPCHRVVTSDGRVGHYAKGTARKIALLKKEGVEVANGRVKDFAKKRVNW